MRDPCKQCSGLLGELRPKNGQDCVYCAQCGVYAYCAPRTETGRRERTIATTHAAISLRQRARIFERDGHRCVLCGRPAAETVLHVGHMLSVADGHDQGLPDELLNCDENLCAMCEECNLGGGRRAVPLRLAEAILRARAAMEKAK